MRRPWRKFPASEKRSRPRSRNSAETGSLKFFEELRAEFPGAILELFSIPGLGAKKIKALYEKLQVSSIAELQAACESGQVAELPGFGKTTQEKICARDRDARETQPALFSSAQIAAEAETLRTDLRAHPDALQVCIAGSYRRRKEIVRDLDFIVATKEPACDHEIVCRTSARRKRDRAGHRRRAACVCAPGFNAICAW